MQREILIVGGDGVEMMASALEEAGYACVCAASVREALLVAEGGRFCLALLDAELPEARAPRLVALLRARGRFPILVLSPAGGRDGLVELLNAGAEDYLTRPFELRELVERIEILLRRFDGARSPQTLRHKSLELDPESFHVTLCERPVKLTKQEFRILELMLRSQPGRVFSKQDFYDYAWDSGYIGVDKTINVHICNIRKKFREITEEPYIETIWGLGFRLI